MLDGRGVQAIADFVVDLDARFAFVAEHANLDELVRFEVDVDLFQHGIGQTLRADEHDGLERMGLGAQIGALGGGEFKSWHEKFGTRLKCGRREVARAAV